MGPFFMRTSSTTRRDLIFHSANTVGNVGTGDNNEDIKGNSGRGNGESPPAPTSGSMSESVPENTHELRPSPATGTNTDRLVVGKIGLATGGPAPDRAHEKRQLTHIGLGHAPAPYYWAADMNQDEFTPTHVQRRNDRVNQAPSANKPERIALRT